MTPAKHVHFQWSLAKLRYNMGNAMSSLLVRLRDVAVALTLLALWAGPSAAALIYRPPTKFDYLTGTEYKVSGINSRLPAPATPTTVKFDGLAESVGIYLVNESIRHFVNDNGQRETWIDFEVTQDPRTLLFLPPGSSVLAEDMKKGWRVNLTDLSTPNGAKIPEYYLYFTEGEVPAPFGRRPGRPVPTGQIGEHPFLDGVSVWRGLTNPFGSGDLPPGAKNGLVTKFEHYFSAVHDVERGLGVPRSINGFHLGYRVEVPEPATCLIGLVVALGSASMLRRRHLTGMQMITK